MREHAYPTDLDPFPRSLRPMETPISKPFVRFRRLGHRESSLESQGPPKMLKSRPRLIVKAQKGASHEGDLPPGNNSLDGREKDQNPLVVGLPITIHISTYTLITLIAPAPQALTSCRLASTVAAFPRGRQVKEESWGPAFARQADH